MTRDTSRCSHNQCNIARMCLSLQCTDVVEGKICAWLQMHRSIHQCANAHLKSKLCSTSTAAFTTCNCALDPFQLLAQKRSSATNAIISHHHILAQAWGILAQENRTLAQEMTISWARGTRSWARRAIA